MAGIIFLRDARCFSACLSQDVTAIRFCFVSHPLLVCPLSQYGLFVNRIN